MTESIIKNVLRAPKVAPDEMNQLKHKLMADNSPRKVDVSAGVYRGDDSRVFTLPCISMAKQELLKSDPGHDYNYTTGIEEFTERSKELLFDDPANVATVQTISGTGSVYLALKLLIKYNQSKDFYVGVPTWPNYVPMIENLNGRVTTYSYYDEIRQEVAFNSLLDALYDCPKFSVFIFQICCHNPTGSDLSKRQWKAVAEIIKARSLVTIFDAAYLGLASGSIEEDKWAIDYFTQQKLTFFVCQSYSKNLGLYSERVGALHVKVTSEDDTGCIRNILRAMIRAEFSSSPAYGARLFLTIMNSESLNRQWESDLKQIHKRLTGLRATLYSLITEKYKIPGNWSSLLSQKGLFWYSGLSREQCIQLVDKNHIYLPSNGRVNIAGLNLSNIDYFASCLASSIKG